MVDAKNDSVFGQSGQSTLEYFILLAVLASLTLIGMSTFLARTQVDVETFTNAAARAMVADPNW